MGNVVARVENFKLLKHGWTNFGELENKLSNSIQPSSSLKPCVFITQNAIENLSDISGGNSSDYTELSPEPQKALYYHDHICSTHFIVEKCGVTL